MNEVWKDIEGYEGVYQISNFGKIKSLERSLRRSNGVIQTRNERLLRQSENMFGYLMVTLHLENSKKTIAVHRLVAKAFVTQKKGCIEVNHIDGNKQNNMADNLEWCTRKQNVDHSFDKGLRRTKGTPYHYRGVIQKDKNGDIIHVYKTIISASRATKVCTASIISAAKGVTRSAGGYLWEYDGKGY